jgi:hypothetical protein
MSFERLAFQVWVEHSVGCVDPDKWDSYREGLKHFEVTTSLKSAAIDAVTRDALSLFHKSVLTFSSAYTDIRTNNRAWSIVKLYYSMFYAVRSRLAARRHALVRSGCWFHFDLNVPQAPAKALNTKRHRNDHDTALHLYEDIFSASDRLLTNSIDGATPFTWMMGLRNIANYRAARFSDPEFLFDFMSAGSLPDARALDAMIAQNVDDVDDILVFQPEHAWLALPMKQLIAACADISVAGASLMLPADQHAHTAKSINALPEKLRQLLQRHNIFSSEA